MDKNNAIKSELLFNDTVTEKIQNNTKIILNSAIKCNLEQNNTFGMV
jgi:hypothetical protein